MANVTYEGSLPTSAMAVYPDGSKDWIGWTYDLWSNSIGQPISRKDYDTRVREYANRLGSDPTAAARHRDDEFNRMESYVMAQSETPSTQPAGTISTTFLDKLNQGTRSVMDGIDSAYKRVINWGSGVHGTVDPFVRSASEGLGQFGESVGRVGGVVSAFSPKTGERLERIGGALEQVDDVYARESDRVVEGLAEAQQHPTVFGKPIDENPPLKELAGSVNKPASPPKKGKPKPKPRPKGMWNLRE